MISPQHTIVPGWKACHPGAVIPSPSTVQTWVPSSLTIMVAVTDSGHRTEIRGGENAGLTVDGDFVVRDMASACTMSAEETDSECVATLSLTALDVPESMQIVAFAQDPDWRIRGVATR